MREPDARGDDRDQVTIEVDFCLRIDSLRRRGQIAKAKEECEDWLRRPQDSSASVHIAYGHVLVAAGLGREAVGVFETARDLGPGNDWPFAGLVAAYSLLQERDKWEQAAAQGLDTFQKSTVIRVALGRARLAAYEYDEALTILSEADRQPGANEMTSRWHFTARAAVYGCSEADKYPPGGVQVDHHRGMIYLDHGQYDMAAKCFKDVRKVGWEYAKALVGLALVAMSEGRVNEAVGFAGQAVPLLPDSPRVLLAHACVLVAAGKYDEGADEARRAYKHAPLQPDVVTACIDVLRRAYKFCEAERMAAEALGDKVRIIQPWRIRTALACVLLEKGDYVQAAEAARGALRQAPKDPEIVTTCVGVLRRAYQFDEAAEEATKALDKEIKQSWQVRTALAWVLSDTGQYEAAFHQVERALRDKQGSPGDCESRWLWLSKIDFLREAHLFEQAEEAANQALKLYHDSPEVLLALAWVLSDQDREEEAAQYATRALGKDGDNPAALVARVYFLRWARKFGTKKEPGEAEKAAKDALYRRPRDPDVLTACGWLQSDLNEPEVAQGYISEALKTDRYNSWALSCKIIFHTMANCHKEAKAAVADALCPHGPRPDDPRLHVAAGWLYGDLDRYGTALEYFDKALSQNGCDAEALEWRIAARRAGLDWEEDFLPQAQKDADLRPFDPGIRVELGRVRDDRREFMSALQEFQQVLERDRDNVLARIAQSATLRAQHLQDEAEREIDSARKRKAGNRELLTELGWIHYDQYLPTQARQEFKSLLAGSRNDREIAAAHYGMGWADMLEGKYRDAEDNFFLAKAKKEKDVGYQLGLAWAIIRQRDKERWDEAEGYARFAAERRRDPLAETCLGVIAFQRGRLAEAERRFKRALELDPSGSPVDLGALYACMARYDEAETELLKALERDPADVPALIELGYLYLQPEYESRPAAERAFRQALADKRAVAAAVGLAQVLAKTGRPMEAESLLRKALEWDNYARPWQAHLALAQLLVQQGSSRQDPGQLSDACEYAEVAIRLAERAESGTADQNPDMPELQFTAGVAQAGMASMTAESSLRYLRQRRAVQYLDRCLRREPENVQARAYRATLQRAQGASRLGFLAVGATAALALALLALEWTLLFVSKKGSITLVGADTPVLAGLFAVSFLLPTLIRLKLPGFEAEMQPKPPHTVPGPTGSDAFGPGRFTIMPGPTGQIPRRGTDTPHPLNKNALIRRGLIP